MKPCNRPDATGLPDDPAPLDHIAEDERAPPFEPLLKAHEVAAWLAVDRRRVYELPIAQIRLSARCIRWRRADVAAHLSGAINVPRT